MVKGRAEKVHGCGMRVGGDPLRRCVLVDDRPGVNGLVKPPPWRQVLFDAPYNRTAEEPRLTSWADWRQVLAQYL